MNLEEDQDVIREFLVESHENLSQLDQDLVELEKHPKDAALLGSVFRTIHTIKGTCGFLAFSTLEKISHQAESLLSQLRDGQRELTPSLVSIILETVDATRKVLASIEVTGKEGPDLFDELTERLRVMAQLPVAKPTRAVVPDPSVARPVPILKPVVNTPVSPPEVIAAAPPEPKEPEKAEKEAEKETEKETEQEAPHPSALADANVRVAVELLDKLMDLVGELVLTRNQILQFNADRADATLTATSQRLNLITTELQEGVMKTRMQPIRVVWSNLPRVVRDMAVGLGKQIELVMEGEDTELDRTIVEAIKDPLVHLVRNSCDHGIEKPEVRARLGKPPQGTLTLRAYHEGGQVNIEISDDGAGIDVAVIKRKAVEKGFLRLEQADHLSDREALNLIFLPGLSTTEVVTRISGRGVGMDVVKSHIEKIGGVVDVYNRLGQGLTIKIKIPLTLAVIPGLVVSLAGASDAGASDASGDGESGQQFVIPQVNLVKLIRLEDDAAQGSIERIRDTAIYRLRGDLLPIVYLHQVLGQKESTISGRVVNIAVLQAEDRQFGLVVDSIRDTQEIVVKPLGKQLKGLPVYAGATIMGDGRVALILDVLGIGHRSGVLTEAREQAHPPSEQAAKTEIALQRLLLFRAGSFERLAIPVALVARLEEFPRSAVEHAGGGLVVQYRQRILPLVSLRKILDSAAEEDQTADPLQVIVLSDADRSVGMVVDRILDIAEEAVTVRQKSDRKGLIGSAVVGKKVTDFLDLNVVIRAGAENWIQGAGELAGGKRILIAEASAFSRGLIRSGLDMAGYRVQEAANLDEAIHSMERQPVDAVVAALDLPPGGTSALLAAMRLRPEWKGIPVLALTDSVEQINTPAVRSAGFQDCQTKFDRVAMLESLARLASAVASPAAAPAAAGKDK